MSKPSVTALSKAVQSKISMPSIVSLALLNVLLPALPAQWTRQSTIDIEVIGDGGERPARALIDRIQEARLVFPAVAPLPVKIYHLGKGDWFDRLRPTASATAFASTDRSGANVIVLSGAADRRALLHEYAHLVMEQMAILPGWLDEGFAELYSTAEVRANRLVVGGAIAPHAAHLKQTGIPALKDLMAPTGHLPAEFYPAAWSFAHMLRFAPRYRERFGAFWAAVQNGTGAATALTAVFDRRLNEIEADWASHVRHGMWSTENLPLPDAIPALSHVMSRPVSRDEFEDEYVDLLRAAGKSGEATRLLAGLRDRPSPHRTLRRAQAALAEGKLDDARRAYEEAGAEGMEGDGWYEYAALLRDLGAREAEIRRALQRSVETSPGLRPARLLLASMDLRAGRFEDAIRHLEVAALKSPRSFEVWYELSFARRSAGQADRAREAAERAGQAARTEMDRERARALLSPVAEQPSAKPSGLTKTGAAWTAAKGDTLLEVEWRELLCGDPARARFETQDGSELVLVIRDPGRITLRNAGSVSAEMKCGAQMPARRVTVEFEAKTRELRAIDFREP